MEDEAMALCSVVLLDLLLALLDLDDLLDGARVVKKAGDKVGDSVVRRVYILGSIELAAFGVAFGHEDHVRGRVGAETKAGTV